MVSEPAHKMIPYTHVLPEEYAFPDPGPVPDSMRTNPIVARCSYMLLDHFDAWDSHDVYIGSGGFVFWLPHCPNAVAEPDLFVAFGVKTNVFPTDGYAIWDDEPPALVLEVASNCKSSFEIDDDVHRKPDLYAQIGIGEYWRFDSTGGGHYGYTLAGDGPVNGIYQPIPITAVPGGTVLGYSPALDLRLCANIAEWGHRLRFYDAKTGRYLLNATRR